jgi:hypothetical protein
MVLNERRVSVARWSAYAIAVAGLVGLLARLVDGDELLETLNDIALLVMTAGLGPVMLGSYELGGRTPLTPSRISLATGIGALVVWAVVQVGVILGAVSFSGEGPAVGALAVQAVALLVAGAWLTGAPLLAGPWLPPLLRVLGAVAGLGFVVFAIGLLLLGRGDFVTYLGGVGYAIVFPIWAFLLARTLSALLRPEARSRATRS